MAFYSESRWPEYVPAALRRRRAAEQVAALKKKGTVVQPVVVEGRRRSIARTFWGDAWCKNLEEYSDYANRLPRGRTYLRNGSVIDLQVAAGSVTALVQGSSVYRIGIKIRPITASRWKGVVRGCSGHIASLVELLRGGVSDHVMKIVTEPDSGLFPTPAEISLKCSCPDWATMCKHVAATLYGVAVRLDERPEQLFTLRGVDAAELVADAARGGGLDGSAPPSGKVLASVDLSAVFGVEIDDSPAPIAKRGASDRKVPPDGARSDGAGAKVAPRTPGESRKKKALAAPPNGAPRKPKTSRKKKDPAARRQSTASPVREASRAELETAAAPPRRRRSAKRPPAPAGRRRGADVTELTARLHGLIRIRPGLRMVEISRDMGTSAKDLVLPMTKLLAKKAVAKRGQKREARYFPR